MWKQKLGELTREIDSSTMVFTSTLTLNDGGRDRLSTKSIKSRSLDYYKSNIYQTSLGQLINNEEAIEEMAT